MAIFSTSFLLHQKQQWFSQLILSLFNISTTPHFHNRRHLAMSHASLVEKLSKQRFHQQVRDYLEGESEGGLSNYSVSFSIEQIVQKRRKQTGWSVIYSILNFLTFPCISLMVIGIYQTKTETSLSTRNSPVHMVPSHTSLAGHRHLLVGSHVKYRLI